MFQRINRNFCFMISTYLYKNLEKECLRNVLLLSCNNNIMKSKYVDLQVRKLSSRNDGVGEFDVIEDLHDKELDNNYSKFSLKEIFYTGSNDELIKSLNDCNCPIEVFKHFERFQDSYDVQHVTQSVILFWNFLKFNTTSGATVNVIESETEFRIFLEKLNNLIYKMNIDEITCCYLYLNKIGVDPNNTTMKNLLQTAQIQISNHDSIIPLTALSRFSVAVKSNEINQNSDICKNIVYHTNEHIKTCTTDKEICLITICMQNLQNILTSDIKNLYKSKVNNLIETKGINDECIKTIIKIINFLSAPYWSQENSILIRDLLLLLSNKILDIPAKSLMILFKVIEDQLEPASFIPKLVNTADKLLEKKCTPEVLACAVQFSQSHKKEKMTEIFKNMFKKDIHSNSLPTYFKILRSLKISDIDLCDLYWTRVVQEIRNIKDDSDSYRLSQFCHRYMFFNNNLGGTYRHLEYEKYASGLLMETITKKILEITPSKFVRLSSFIIAYGHTNELNGRLPEFIIDQIEEMCNHFTIMDCLQLSRGLQIALELRYRLLLPRDITKQLLRIENVLNNCAEKYLLSDNLSLNDLNCIIRSFNNRRASRKTAIYKKAIEKYKNCEINLNSRIIRDITFNLNTSNYLETNLYGEIFKYIVQNRDYIMGDTVEKIIFSAYQLGYMPESDDALHWSGEIINRDLEYMTSLSIVQACIALSFYKALPESLIHKVFSIDFIQRIEKEIETCYSKATYPDKILNQVMQLNRTVCLDFPEAQVPWFQQNYIEAQISKKHVVTSKFYIDIKKLLISIIQLQFVRCNYVTPYGYIIDFVILFDKYNKPIFTSMENIMEDKITKVGILLLKEDSYCDNSNLKGKDNLKIRHLEILGYKVITINLKDWNSMYMNVPGKKLSFLKYLLDIK